MENKKEFIPDPNLKRLGQVCETLCYYHYERVAKATYLPGGKTGSTHVKFRTKNFRWLHDEGKRR